MTKLATRLSLLFVALALPALAQIPAASVPDGFAQRMYSASWLEGNAAAVPYLVPTNATVPSGEAVLALARGLGADIPDGSTAQGMPSIGKLVVKTSPAAFAEIERLLGVLGSPAGERVEIAASLLVVADADFDAFLGRFGVAKSPAALLAPVLARAPSLDDLVDLAESPPAPSRYATWARLPANDGDGKPNYYHGHYCSNRAAAVGNFCERAREQYAYEVSVRRIPPHRKTDRER